MIDDPKKNQGQQDEGMDDYKGIQSEEGSAGGVASQDTGVSENLGDLGTSTDLNQDDTDKDMTE